MKLNVDADLFLFDLDGTVYLGDTPIEGAIATLKALDSLGKKVCFLTNNSSKDKSEYVEKLNAMGYPATDEQIITSATATVHYLLTSCKGKSVYPLGTPTFVEGIRNAGIVIDENQADIVVLAFDTTVTYDKFWKANVMLDNGSDFIATHPDKVCPSDRGNMPDVGSLTELLKCSSGKAPMAICGKPYKAMAEIVEKTFSVQPERIAMVGDRLYTDIQFGLNNGYISIAVLTGETTREMLKSDPIKPTVVMDSIVDLIEW